jgi:POT family proton-dependent oligopeptide transporter
MPFFGAYVAETYLGRYKTICIALVVAITAHVIFVVASLPPIITNNKDGALGIFILGIILLGIGTCGFKQNISLLIIERTSSDQDDRSKATKRRAVIHGPALPANRVYMYFYLFINIGALIGQLAMSYTEKFVGFWLAWLLPTFMLCICPLAYFGEGINTNELRQRDPSSSRHCEFGSLLSVAVRRSILSRHGRTSTMALCGNRPSLPIY